MHTALFLVTILISVVVVKAGAAAFHLTGLNWSAAWFQAMSCFTTTGFTTRESELIMSHAQRRKIAMVLMVLGNAGFVTLIATLAGSMQPMRESAIFSVLGIRIPAYLQTVLNLLLMLVGMGVIAALFSRTWFGQGMTTWLRKRLGTRWDWWLQLGTETLLTADGVGVATLTLEEGAPSLGGPLERLTADSGLRVVGLERGGATTLDPKPDEVLERDDRLICIGRVADLHKAAKSLSGCREAV